MKIIQFDGKCWNCPYLRTRTDGDHSETACLHPEHINTNKYWFEPHKAEKDLAIDCPLQEVEVRENKGDEIRYGWDSFEEERTDCSEITIKNCARNIKIEDIEVIYIVKKESEL